MSSQNSITIPTGPGYKRFSSEGFCPSKLYRNFYDGMFSMFDESNFYTNILQFALVTLMYINIGKGRYWKILYYASISGVIGTLIEKGTVSYVCRVGDINNERSHLYSLLVAEIFWVVKEYAIPFLNLTKMKAFSNGKYYRILNVVIYVLFFAFVVARFYIGYERSVNGVLSNKQVKYGHMAAFTIMAIADLICTTGILYFVNNHNRHEFIENNDIDHYIKRSSYIILVCVDIVSILLAILNGITVRFNEQIPESFTRPFHSVKCSFILILACDALLFKYSVNTSSVRSSSNNKYGNGDTKSMTYNNNSNNNRSQIDGYPFNYSNLDYAKSKSIIKNYTNITPSPSSGFYDAPVSDFNKNYPSQSFGFLYQSKQY